MKKVFTILLVVSLWRIDPLGAQTNAPGSYASDVDVIIDAQRQALTQARQALEHGGSDAIRTALNSAIKEMEQSQTALADARKSPDKLPAAVAAAQSAYQALLKATPREYRMNRSRQNNQGSGSGQPSEQEMNQLELTKDDDRYQNERQAQAAPTAQQREQNENLDRLKQLARRQQDLNDRLRDLQSALQEAKTDSEREDIQRQLKRLRDEERQMLSDVDQMRQNMEQSPNASQQSQSRQQLEQTRNDIQRAAQELEKQSVSEALAAGSRAEEKMQDMRESLRQQSSSQFSRQMRDLRNQAHDLAAHEDQIAQDLEKMNNSSEKSLNNSSPRQTLADQLAHQQTALTNLLDQMRTVTEQAENTEPLLSKQLYDVVRHTEQSHADNQLDMSSRLVDRGFLPQAGESEKAARQNIDELKQNVDRAADSVLGSETDALKYAQKQLDELSSELSHDLNRRTNNAAGVVSQPDQSAPSGTNGGAENLRRFAQQLGSNNVAGGQGDKGENGPITGNNFVDWSDRMRDVEQSVNSQDIRNQLATVRERIGVYRRNFRQAGRLPPPGELQNKALEPLALARDWVGQELARSQNDRSLVPLDRDPVQDKYSDLVRKYYEKLGSPQ